MTSSTLVRDNKKLALKSMTSLARPGTSQALDVDEQIEEEMARHEGEMVELSVR